MILSAFSSPVGPAPVLSFTPEGDDALCVAVTLASLVDCGWVSTSTCSALAGLSLSRTERALRTLTSAGILDRRRGRSGGFMLQRSGSAISVGEVLRAATMTIPASPSAATTVLEVVMRDLSHALDGYTVASLATRIRPNHS